MTLTPFPDSQPSDAERGPAREAPGTGLLWGLLIGAPAGAVTGAFLVALAMLSEAHDGIANDTALGALEFVGSLALLAALVGAGFGAIGGALLGMLLGGSGWYRFARFVAPAVLTTMIVLILVSGRAESGEPLASAWVFTIAPYIAAAAVIAYFAGRVFERCVSRSIAKRHDFGNDQLTT